LANFKNVTDYAYFSAISLSSYSTAKLLPLRSARDNKSIPQPSMKM